MDDTVFDEFDKLEQFVWATERAADGALLESERFLRESSIRISGAGALPASATSSSGHTDGSAAARPDRCPGIDLASAAAKPGKCPGRDPASAAARSDECPGRDPASTAARPGKCPGRDPASTAARPGKCPGRDPASTAARSGKTRQLPRQRPGGYPGKALQ